ncbi:MAG: acyl--CoA ligase, partial [Clostridiales Family XIII bacterium]|nr:acyl--CoA ligase [Clostridiales Family XIII bacterium]
MNSLRYKDERYKTRPVTDLRDLMNSGAEIYGDRAAYLVKRAPGSSFAPVSYRQFRSDVTALGTALLDAGYLPAKGDSSDTTALGTALLDAGYLPGKGDSSDTAALGTALLDAGYLPAKGDSSDTTALGTALLDAGYLPAKGDSSDTAALGTALLDAEYLPEKSNDSDKAHGSDRNPVAGTGAHKIAIISENSYEYVVAYFAVVCGGGIVVPIDPRLPAAEASNLLRRADVATVFHSKKYKNAADTAHTRIPMDEVSSFIAKGEGLIKSGDDSYFHIALDPRQVCALLFTSGTTGASKGVMLSHANLVSNVSGMSAFINAAGKVSLSVLPMH